MTQSTSVDARPLAVLVLGGTSWLGGAVATAALRRGHRVTCLARGESGEPPGDVRWVRADRQDETAYDEVATSDWDVVVDVSWQPGLVRSALRRLGPRTRHWVYVSSASVYADDDTPGSDEQARLHPAHAGEGPVGWDSYGPAKVACEQAVLEAQGREHALLARAGLIGGYGDRSDRLGYWPARLAAADDLDPVLLPPRSSPCQVIDVEDLADWLVRAGEDRVAGAFNAVGDVTTVGAVVDECVSATGTTPRFVEATDEQLLDLEVAPWSGPESLPLWLPLPDYAGFMTRRNERALAAGLVLRPLSETIRTTAVWERECGLGRERQAGLSRERERDLLGRLATWTRRPPAAGR